MMAKIRVAALIAACGRASAGACDGDCTKLSDGLYCPVNDVREHADVNKDVAEIAGFLKESPLNYAEAKTVYQGGKESCKSSTVLRTLQDLAQKDMIQSGKYTNDFFSGALDLYGSINAIWHDWIIACLDNSGSCQGKSDDFRKYIINKGLIGVVTAYVTYETGVAKSKAAQGQTADDGAAYNWDEGAAFHIGRKATSVAIGGNSAPSSLYSPWEFNWKRDSDYPDGVKTHQHALWSFNHGLLNLRGSYTAQAVETAEMAIYKIYAITAIRSAIKYGWKAYGGGTFQDKYLAEGAMYFRSASGYLSTFNKTIVQQVDAIFALSKTSFSKDDACMVKTLLESMYADAGISCAEVGAWKDAEDCIASACSPAGNDTLSDGDSSFLTGCVADTGDGCGTDANDGVNTDSAATVGLAGAAAAAALAMLM